MPVFQDGYSTSHGSMIDSKKIILGIREAMTQTYLTPLDVKPSGNVSAAFVTGVSVEEQRIDAFTHPILVESKHSGDPKLVTDLRLYIQKDKYDGSLGSMERAVRNLTDFNFAKSRAILNLIWVEGARGKLSYDLNFAGVVYARLISKSIGASYTLDLNDQETIAVAAHLFYQSLFNERTSFDGETIEKWSNHTMNALGSSDATVRRVASKVEKIQDITDLVSLIKESVESIRLEDFNLLGLLTSVRNIWYGSQHKEIIPVSLEHPPTWMAVVYAALSERLHKSSMVYRIAGDWGRRGVSDTFQKNYVRIILEQKSSEARQALENLPIFK